jgi:hypothetical protein
MADDNDEWPSSDEMEWIGSKTTTGYMVDGNDEWPPSDVWDGPSPSNPGFPYTS